MKFRIYYKDIIKDPLFIKCLRESRVLTSSIPYIISEYFQGNFEVLNSKIKHNVALLEDNEGKRYKVMCSKNGQFYTKQSCQKGVGRDESFGNWISFVRDHRIDYLMLVTTKYRDYLEVEIVDANS